MECPRCGNVASPGIVVCPKCGAPLAKPGPNQSVAMPAAPAQLAQAFDAQRKKNTTVAVAIIAVVAAGLILFGIVKGLGALGVWAKKDDANVLAAGKLPDMNILTAQGKPIDPILTKPAPDQAKMPDDVLAWLRHLEKCEAIKVEIAGDQSAEVTVWMTKNMALGAGMGLMDPYDQSQEEGNDQDPATYTKGKMLDLRPQWDQLIAYFNSVPPPEECRPIADDFGRALNEIPGMMGDIGDILNNAMQDPQSALQNIKKLQNGSYSDVDRYFARADQKVSGICAKYQVSKWFNIKTDVSAGGMLGTSGMGLGGTMPQIPSGVTAP